CQCLTFAVLKKIQIDAAFALSWIADQACDGRQSSMHDVGQQLGELLRLVMSQAGSERYIDMYSAFARGLAKSDAANLVQNATDFLCHPNKLVEGHVYRIEVQQQIIS